MVRAGNFSWDTLNKQESILNGPILRHNTKALDDNVIGKFIALAIVRSFLPYDYLFDAEGTDAQIENVPDLQIQGKIKKVSCSVIMINSAISCRPPHIIFSLTLFFS